MLFAFVVATLSSPLVFAAEHNQTATSSALVPSSTAAPNITTSTALRASANLAGSFGVSGQIAFALGSTSDDVTISISVSGLNALNASAEYAYHIHTNPISTDGNCSAALGHLDPLQVTDSITCDPLLPQYCQEGDLAGRHGKLPGNITDIQLDYTDKFIRFWPQPFSILGRSVVIHAPNSTRLACGNITSIVDGTADTNGKPTGKESTYVTDYPSKAAPAGPKVAPFVGTMTDTAVLATITLPAALPDVDAVPNVVLTASAEIRTINSTVATITLPVAYAAPTSFMYTSGAALPSQAPVSSSTSSTPSVAEKQGSSSTASQLNFVPSFTVISILSLFLFL
jgi:Cu/Zn superoxide dismutase